MKIYLESVPFTSKEKFMFYANNKIELIKYLSVKLRNSGISDNCCRDEADAEIVPSALDHASVGMVNIRAED